MGAKILIVEDEPKIHRLLAMTLATAGYETVSAFSLAQAEKLLFQEVLQLVILDLNLPDGDGLSLLESPTHVPMICLTARGDVMDKVKGLSRGAEDYLAKPFEMAELLARVQVILRRYQPNEVIEIGQTKIDLANRQCFVEDELQTLTPQEFTLLEAFITNKNMALSREQLLDIGWGYDYDGDIRTVDVHVQRLRKKLQLADVLKTVYKFGYRLEI